jgi:hypothetical protein
MAPSGAEKQSRLSRLSRLARSQATRLTAPLAGLAVLLAVDSVTGPEIRLGGLMAAMPALSAVFLGPVRVLIVAVVTVPCVVLAAAENETLGSANFMVILATVILVGAGAVMASVVRRRRERQLSQARWVADVTQRALLRPLPARVGALTISSMYLAAEEEAAIGGDLYAAAIMGDGAVRTLIGDVQGKGLDAVEVTSLVLSAFRRAARVNIPLAELPAYLDRSLRDDLTDLATAPAGSGYSGSAGETVTNMAAGTTGHPPPAATPTVPDFVERFVTAIVIDAVDDCGTIRVANCGHPPPLLLHGARVTQLDSAVPALPLGLGDLGPERKQHIDTFPMGIGDILLLHTDGVTEARDSSGTFYPLADRLPAWCGRTPDQLLEAIRTDLTEYVDARLVDDVALVALQRQAP